MSASPQALAAVRAAKNAHKWGPFATLRYIQKNNVPARMWAIVSGFECWRTVPFKVVLS